MVGTVCHVSSKLHCSPSAAQEHVKKNTPTNLDDGSEKWERNNIRIHYQMQPFSYHE